MIDNCPNCAYSIVGLRDRSYCPECGTEFEREAILFVPARAPSCGLGSYLGVSVLFLAAPCDPIVHRTGVALLSGKNLFLPRLRLR